MSLENNIKKIYLLRFFGMFFLLMPVIVPFFHSLGLDMQEVFLLQSVFAATVFILEIPSGYVCDLLGRKRTLLIALFFKGVGFTMLALSTNVEQLIVAEIIIGIGLSLSSGTDTALIYDTMEIVSPNKAQIKVLGKSLFYMSLGEGMAALIASLLMIISFSIEHLAYISAVMCWIPFVIALTIVEPPRKKMENSHRENFKYIFRKLFRQSKLLNLILLNMILYSTATLFAVWIFQKYWGNLGIPLLYFGFLWALINFVVSFTSKKAHKLEKRWGSSTLLIIIGLLPIGGYFGISLIEQVWGAALCLLFQFCRGFGQVIFRDALNKRVTADFRATANSIAQMGTRIIFICLGPLWGHVVDIRGISYATAVMTAVMVVVFLVAMLPLLREKKNFIAIR